MTTLLDSALRPLVHNSLDAFVAPRSLAVVGASNNEAKWGYWLARGALAGAVRRNVYLVNARGRDVLGQPTYRTLADLPEVPELVALCVPADSIDTVVDEGLALGTKGFLGITAGIADHQALVARVRTAGARLVGPNSLGIYNAATELCLAWGEFSPGHLAIVSQSGQIGSELAKLGQRADLGVSRFVSLGNQADVTASEVLHALTNDESTTVVALYLESFERGRSVIEAMQALKTAGKHVLVLTTGESDGSKRLAATHTGSLTTPLDVVDAACRAAGATRVNTPADLIGAAALLMTNPAPTSARVAIVSDSGGQGGIAADSIARHGLELPPFSLALQAQLHGLLPAGAAVSNPIDLAGAGEQDLHTYERVISAILDSGEVDSLVLTGYFGCYADDTPTLAATEHTVADALAGHSRNTGLPVVVHSMSDGSSTLTRLRGHGTPTYRDIDAAVSALRAATDQGTGTLRTLETLNANRTPAPATYSACRVLLQELGIPMPRAETVTDENGLDATEHLTYPVVLKAGWLAHKTEYGGIQLDIPSRALLADALRSMRGRLGPGEYVVEEQDVRSHVVEILVTGREDLNFGPVIAVGAGGTETELYRDLTLELAPVDSAQAHTMLQRLRCYPLLTGWRGNPSTDLDSLAEIVVAASRAVATHTDLVELELNPVRVAPNGALAVDALAVAQTPPVGADDDRS